MRKISLIVTTLLLILLCAVPVLAVVITPSEETTQTTQIDPPITQTTDQTTVTQTTSQGVQPISPAKIQSKVDEIEGWAVELMAPVIHLMSKLSLIMVVLLLLVAVFVRNAFSKAFMLAISVFAAMAIFSNVSGITNTIQWMGQWLGQ